MRPATFLPLQPVSDSQGQFKDWLPPIKPAGDITSGWIQAPVCQDIQNQLTAVGTEHLLRKMLGVIHELQKN